MALHWELKKKVFCCQFRFFDAVFFPFYNYLLGFHKMLVW